ncbi:hypothetical protein QOZ95_001800 [Paenibacillus brasilensis]|uniref:Uncharacterized protein n=1 Tax=Paenibacillus brasilensis TaxID=128574 RepID=A0ABU0KW19_9BACL|nr:hypothetical protein [Paenibacillus brasilensis]
MLFLRYKFYAQLIQLLDLRLVLFNYIQAVVHRYARIQARKCVTLLQS